jgi:hypothetical protein
LQYKNPADLQHYFLDRSIFFENKPNPNPKWSVPFDLWYYRPVQLPGQEIPELFTFVLISGGDFYDFLFFFALFLVD